MGSTSAAAATGFEYARAVADAILYEGYLLYPYRRSSGKNRVRWQFGVLVPPAWAKAHGLTDTGVAGSAEGSWQQTECLIDAPDTAVVNFRIRFLQLQKKSVELSFPDGSYESVDSLDAGERVEFPFEEAVPQEFDLRLPLGDALDGDQDFAVQAPAGEETEPVLDGTGSLVGRLVRRRRALTARVTVSATRCDTPRRLVRLRVRVDNADTAATPAASRDEALQDSLLACHLLLETGDGAFVSLLDPPAWAEPAARECENVHVFPVLAGPEGDRGMVLASPILLYDHPRIAPESPGDLHDSGEIDEILTLRTLTLTDAEKREARATDARAAEIIDRTESMPPEVFARLHGVIRSLKPVAATGGSSGDPVPWWEPGGDDGLSPETDAVLVEGVRVAKGSRVRLRPRTRGTDPQDRFLDGRTALVEAVLTDVDDAVHLAVTVEDDPAADLNQWYGRFRYFSPDEVEPMHDRDGEEGTG